MKFKGHFKGMLYNPKTGEITCWEKDNKVVQAGFDFVCALLTDPVSRPAPISYIAFGTGLSATTDEMTALENEVYRGAITTSWDAENRIITVNGEIPVGSSVSANISEVGLFNASTGGVMFDRAIFSPKGMDPELAFKYTFTITITS